MKLLLLLIAASAARAEFLHVEVFMKDMNCASCSDSMGKAFEKIRGVTHVDVSMEHGTVALDLAEGNRVTLEQIWDTVKRIGFTPGDTKVSVRGSVQGAMLNVSVIDKSITLDGKAPEGEKVQLKGVVTPPPDPRTPMKLRIQE
jgi:copper chaperone CopZ